MAGFLDQYDAGGERREKIIKWTVATVLAVLIIGGTLFFIFHNYRQEAQVKRFFELLQAHNYQGAYEMWVRTASDREGYPYSSFLGDWGPQGQHADVSNFRISRSRSCGSGVIITANFGRNQQEKLWVQRDDLTIGFSPLPGCPAPR